jgi:hypothetical protein
VRGEDEEEFCKALIQHYLSEQTVPFKEPADAYPWILPANKEWLARHSTRWQELFIEEYSVSQESMEGDNTEDRIRHHIEVAQRILGKLNIATLLQEKGIDIGKLSIPGLEQIYRELTLRENAGKYDETLLKNLRTQRDALRDLQGERKKREAKKITIVPEFDPLEILQMGNRVSGSCLSVDGSNKWSAIVNAMEVNKRVLWAKDESQNIIGRLLIAVDDSDQIVKFEIYYATHMKLNTYFDDYIRKLAERCNLGLNGKAKNVSNLVAKRWYRDPERNVQE